MMMMQEELIYYANKKDEMFLILTASKQNPKKDDDSMSCQIIIYNCSANIMGTKSKKFRFICFGAESYEEWVVGWNLSEDSIGSLILKPRV